MEANRCSGDCLNLLSVPLALNENVVNRIWTPNIDLSHCGEVVWAFLFLVVFYLFIYLLFRGLSEFVERLF